MPWLLASILCAAPVLGEEPGVVAFLYIEANEGGSSGGHAGLRIGDEVYHFQHRDDALELQHTYWDAFSRSYTRLENRPLHELQLRASANQARSLERVLRQERRRQQRAFAALAALTRERTLLAALTTGRHGSQLVVAVPGAGYFERRSADGGSQQAPGWIDAGIRAARLRQTEAIRAGLRPSPPPPPPATGAAGPPADYGWGERIDDLAAAEVALEVIEGARVPARESFRRLLSLRLETEHRRTLRSRWARQRAELESLLAGSRPDWGHAFLVGLARLSAIEQSLEAGHLVVLDAFPEASGRLGPETWRHSAHARTASGLLDRTDQDLRRALAALDDSQMGYAALERAANRWLELRISLHGGQDLRLHAGPWAPDRPGPHSLALGWRPFPGELEARRAQLEASTEERTAALLRTHRYLVARHNCVSALFDLMARAAPESPAWQGPRPATPARLIPWIAAHWVHTHHEVEARIRHAPERERRLQAAAASGGALTTRLRESNVLTATLYAPHAADSSFLFFTQDVAWARPVLGGTNLCHGVFTSLLGLLKLPWEQDTIEAGVMGAFWSLPELVFVNVRKGTYPIVLPDPAELPPAR